MNRVRSICTALYGCLQRAADEYIIDYARTFGIPALVFRMSCIYGPHQFGNEDQGWIAHFLICAPMVGRLRFTATARQVRDVLFVDDLVEAFLLGARIAVRSPAKPSTSVAGHRTRSVCSS